MFNEACILDARGHVVAKMPFAHDHRGAYELAANMDVLAASAEAYEALMLARDQCDGVALKAVNKVIAQMEGHHG